MFIVVVIWCALYPALGSAYIGNSADPRDAERYTLWMAKQLGSSYGIHAIWAWLLVALIDWPKVKPDEKRAA